MVWGMRKGEVLKTSLKKPKQGGGKRMKGGRNPEGF